MQYTHLSIIFCMQDCSLLCSTNISSAHSLRESISDTGGCCCRRETMSNLGGGNQVAQRPTSFGPELRTCLRCRLIKTLSQFLESGCENCPFFEMKQDKHRVVEATTSHFSGVISVMDPSRSWAARWLRVGKFVPGCYSLSVSKALTTDLQIICENQDIPYDPPKRH